MTKTSQSNPLVSIIIPIYKVERHLKQCLKSVIGQTYKNLEIILVNDASPDGSLAICEWFAARDSRIKIIDKKINEGLDLARFSGLNAATGEYIYFIDSDDWLARIDIIELMVEKAEATGADYVWMALQRVLGKHAWVKQKMMLPKTGLVEKEELQNKYYLQCFGWPVPTPYLPDKLYRYSTIKKSGLRPSGLRIAEDTIFNLQLFPYLEKVYFLNLVGYNYRWGGMWGKPMLNFLPPQKKILEIKIEEAVKNKFPQGIHQAKLMFLAVFESAIILCLTAYPDIDVKKMLERELGDAFWDDILRPDEYPEMFQTPFMKALAARDVDTMITLSMPAAKKMKIMGRLKKIANVVLSRI